MCLTKIFVSYALGACVKIEALKKAVAEADNKAAAEQALREKHEARVVEAERELQEAMKKSETLEQSLERAEEELGRVKKQLEDKQGMLKPY